jgi:hypothetical protein
VGNSAGRAERGGGAPLLRSYLGATRGGTAVLVSSPRSCGGVGRSYAFVISKTSNRGDPRWRGDGTVVCQGGSSSTFAASASRGNPSALQCVGTTTAPRSACRATCRRLRTHEGARGHNLAGVPHNSCRRGACGGGAYPRGEGAHGSPSGAGGCTLVGRARREPLPLTRADSSMSSNAQ